MLSFLLASAVSSYMLPVHRPTTESVVGSSVLLSKDLVLTAAHVATEPVMQVECKGELIPASVVKYDDVIDLALLRLARPCSEPTVEVAKRNPEPGDAVLVDGCPNRECGWRLRGYVVGYKMMPVGNHPERLMLVTDARVYFGNSGGPMVDSTGHLVGICSQIFQFAGPVPGLAPVFGAFVPAESIAKFLKAEPKT